MAEGNRIIEQLRRPQVAIPAGAVVLGGATAGLLGFFLQRWVYVVVALLALLVGLLAFLIWNYYARERDERIARGTGAEDDPTLIQRRGSVREERRAAEALEVGFQKALAWLEERKLGSLPWYLVIGAPGAGKTALLRLSGLDLPAAVERLVEAGPTASCNWWLTNQAVLVDTAGRLTVSHERPDHREWRRLLVLIRKHRRRPAIHGVLVVLSAADLLGKSDAQIEADGSELRRYLNEIGDVLGVDPPIYLLVSQADRIQGIAELASLARDRVSEVFGWTNRERHPHDVGQSVSDGVERIRSRVEALLPELYLRESSPDARRRLFLMTQELDALGARIATLARRAFQPTRYDEVPFLRGIYLTSAKREGSLVSPLLERLGVRWATAPVDAGGPAGGWFLRDLFRRLLLDSEEQSLAVPLDRVGPRTRAVLVGLVASAALVGVGLWSVSFYRNWASIGALRTAAAEVEEQKRNLVTLDRLREAIEAGEADREDWLHGMGLGAPLSRALERASGGFVAAFGKKFEEPAKRELLARVRQSDDEAFAALQDVAADLGFLATRAQAVAPGLERYSDGVRNEVERKVFAQGYQAFVAWAPEPEIVSRIDQERQRLDSEAPRLLGIERLESWCRAHPEAAAPVRHKDLGLRDAGEVLGCYTSDFFERRIAPLVAGLEHSGKSSRESIDRFRDDYERRYAESYEDLLVGAPRPPVAHAEVRKSPYPGFLARVGAELRVEGLWRGEAPVWVRSLHEVLRSEGGSEEKPAPWKRYEAALDRVAGRVEQTVGRSHAALALAREVADGQDTPFQQTVVLVHDDLVPIPPEDPDPTEKTALRNLLLMPVLDGFSAVLVTAAREIDQVWQSCCVAPFPPPLGPESFEARRIAIQQFKSQTLAPFWSGSGPRPLLVDRALPLTDRFVVALGGVAPGGQGGAGGGGGGGGGPPPSGPQTVRLSGVPSVVTGGGDVFVTSQELMLTCASQPVQRFEYSDGSGSQSFTWRPDCDLVQLVVRVRAGGRDVEIPREWSGPFAFADFLEQGGVTLHVPGAAAQVRVRYQRSGGDGILAYKRAMSRAMPESAVQ